MVIYRDLDNCICCREHSGAISLTTASTVQENSYSMTIPNQ